MKTKMKIMMLVLVLAAGVLVGTAQAGEVYGDPGWAYVFEGVLDATWDHDNGSDQWDDSAIGSGRPGGVSALTDGSVTYVRAQDTGDPRDHGYADDGSNRKLYFTHNISNESLPDDLLTNGVTLSFRARIATGAPLDPMYPDSAGDGENNNLAGGTAWPAGGNGYLGHNDGKGSFGVHYEGNTDDDPTNDDLTISFSLALAGEDEYDENNVKITTSGLYMNALSGTSNSGSVDPWQQEGTENVLAIADPTQWHEFWITIEANTSGGGTHKVEIYMDGSTSPATFHVTAGDDADEGYGYLAMGCGATGQMGAIDIDFYAYKPGVHAPIVKLRPKADAGTDQLIILPDTQTTLAAEIQDDGDPNHRLNYWWEVVSQPDGSTISGLNLNPLTITIPGTVEPNTPYPVTPTVTIDKVGVYTLKLNARDEENDTNDTVQITVYPEGSLGLVAHWKLDEGADTVAQDSAENFYDPNDDTLGFDRLDVPGELISANGGPDPNWIDGPDWQNTNLLNEPNDFLGAIWLDNDFQQYIAIRNLHYESSSLEECTVTAWIKTDGSGDQMIASFDRNEYWRLEVNGNGGGDGQIGWDVLTSSGQVDMGSSTRVDDNEWHHVAGVFDNGTLKIYIDGVEDATASGGSTFGSGNLRYGFIGVGSEASAYNGSRGPTSYFNGGIDDVRIYNIALTQQEILDVAGIENTPPTADAGPDLRVIQDVDGNTKLISGAVVTDIPGAYTTTWEVLSGPSAVSFLPDENTDNPTVQFNVGAFGLYHLQITVQDANPAYDPVVDDLYIMYQEKSQYSADKDDPMALWKLDESGTDLNAIDSSGNDLHGPLATTDTLDPNLPEWQPGQGKVPGGNQGALKFVNAGDDKGQYVDLSIVPGTEDLTVTLWMKAEDLMNAVLFDKINSEDENGWGINISGSGQVSLQVGPTQISSSDTYAADEWVHVAATFDGTADEGKIYINGLEQGSSSGITASANNFLPPLILGNGEFPLQIITNVDRTNGVSGDRDHIGAYDGETDPIQDQPDPLPDSWRLRDGHYCFSDRDYLWESTPTAMIDSVYVTTFNSDKDVNTANYAVTISGSATFWITVDDRKGNQQAYADLVTADFATAGTFTDSGINLTIGEGGGRPMSVFISSVVVPAGTYNFASPQMSGDNYYTIGAFEADTGGYRGLVDQVRLFDVVLSELDIALLAVSEGAVMEDCILSIPGVQMAGDLDGNCYVDVRDLKIMLGSWLICKDLNNPNCW